ncbi:MAG: alanine--tRNA ligase [Actinomycetota bacterium]
MKSTVIRDRFLKFFKDKNHSIIQSSSLIPVDDPTVLLTTAGVQQIMPFFSGLKEPPSKRLVSCQKCFRTTDIDNVGLTPKHLTFFEMLGNFSIGDYFKEKSIYWAWEFLTRELKIDSDKLWVTVFEGDEEIPVDDAAIAMWKEVGVSPDKIYKFGKADNFWGPPGEKGPCGPCSEIHFDRGEQYGCQKDKCGPNCEQCDRFIEVWNLVFTQYNFDGKKYDLLPQKNIDTGMGLERLVSIMQNVESVFDTDLYKEIIKETERLSNKKFNVCSDLDRSFRIIADHLKGATFLISDGVFPSNEGRGYVLRRIIRRAITNGKSLGIKDEFITKISEIVINVMSSVYPELKDKRDYILDVLETEEKKFHKTLIEGTKILEENIKQLKKLKKSVIPGDIAFKLYDTYGFPIDLTKNIANKYDFTTDTETYRTYMEEQKNRSRSVKGFFDKDEEALKLYSSIVKGKKIKFVGYEKDFVKTDVVGIISKGVEVQKVSKGDEAGIIISETPFYAEEGGQVGDIGHIVSETGKFSVDNTFPIDDILNSHQGKVIDGEIKIGQIVEAKIDIKNRISISKNHTATHLLHWALRTVLGDHVNQSGSLVEAGRLRFDFTHHLSLSNEQREKVENLVNKMIFANHDVRAYITTLDYAKEIGAIMIFEEKYGDFVRVLEIGDFSRELCGGTHIAKTGSIGLFKIISEGSIGSNLRRIEAITGKEVIKYISKQDKIISSLSELLSVEKSDIIEKIKKLIDDLKKKESELEEIRKKTISSELEAILNKYEEKNEIKIFSGLLKFRNIKDLQSMVRTIQGKFKDSFVVLGSNLTNKAILVTSASGKALEIGIDCNEIANAISKYIDGGGGGKKEFAQVGGKNTKGTKLAIDKAIKIVESLL